MKKNEEIEITITDITKEGNGVGRYEGMAVFVPFSAVGDQLRVRIVKVNSSFCYGKIIEIIKPSATRCSADCASFFRCGGCAFRHITYEEECRLKEKFVVDCFRRIGGIEMRPEKFLRGEPQSYRNKAQYPFCQTENGITAGFFAKRSHRVIPDTGCAIQPPEFSKIVQTVCAVANRLGISVYDETTQSGLLRHLFIRKAEATGEYMVVLVINGNTLPGADVFYDALVALLGAQLVSFQLNFNTEDTNVVLGKRCKVLYGQNYITDILCGKKIRISPLSFYQVNRTMAEKLYEQAAIYAEPQGKYILDLYCGTGTIGLSMADAAKRVLGVEIVEQAVHDAKVNARVNGVENISFLSGDAAKFAAQGEHADVVIIDPPRKGCSTELLEIIEQQLMPERVIYISCDPATLARDCKHFTENGYCLSAATVADLFPRTGHVESVVQLLRN
ncbi:MAG: 23S rRNA (uracil(1939)-C(5))-methyltransferase RlmD [Clostridia bacterium]|nr:23S rRNA (uracil(1939)-C(5))-methyltransferase RlmD [Clostridia bacterium]